MKERALQQRLARALRRCGGYWEVTSPSPWSTSGRPDIMGCYRGTFVAFEIKHPDEACVASPPQKLRIAQIRAAGGCAAVVNSVDMALAILATLDPKGAA